MAEVEAKVKAIIADKLGVEESQVTKEANFQTDLGADSLDTVEMIMEFEKEFGIEIPDEDTQKISTVGDAIAYVEGKLAKSFSLHISLRVYGSTVNSYTFY